MPTDARARLLQSAGELFYMSGVASTGIDQLLDHSKVGRASLYRHFAGKDELVAEFVRTFGERWRAWLGAYLDERPGDPLAPFDALAQRCAADGFRGCAAINTMIEVTDQDSPAVRAAVAHKRASAELLEGYLRGCGCDQPEELAEDFQLLLDGAIVVALRDGAGRPARRAKELARARLHAGRLNPSGGRHG